MINTVLIDTQTEALQKLASQLDQFCPEILTTGMAHSVENALQLINHQKPNLVFMGIEISNCTNFHLYCQFTSTNFETIFIGSKKEYAFEAIRRNAVGFILKPVKIEELLVAAQHASLRIKKRETYQNNRNLVKKILNRFPDADTIGIPTIEGFEFIAVNDIIHCEGQQKNTRVVTKGRSDIISSYNLGTFRKLLDGSCFFSPHKSHLINLNHIKKFNIEGTIIMKNNDWIPVARRRKSAFLNEIKRF